MIDRYTKVLLTVIAALSVLLLTSCSNPDTSGGVTMQKEVGDGHPSNWPFPHGSCSGAHTYAATNTGCGWISYSEKSYYIEPNSNFQKLGLWGLDLSGANLASADLSGAILSTEGSTNMNLSNAILTNATLTGAGLDNTNFTGADLSGADLTNAGLYGANLSNANLDGANLTGATLTGTLMEGAILCNTTMPSGTVIFSGC